MIPPLLVVAWLAAGPVTTSQPGGPSRLVLRDGTVYFLKEAPRMSGTRVIFTTTEGKTFSMDEKEIDSIGSTPRAPAAPRRYDQGDSRELGAIARQQRDVRGKRAEVAPRAPRAARAPRTVKSPKGPRSRSNPPPRPRPSPAGPAAGKASPG